MTTVYCNEYRYIVVQVGALPPLWSPDTAQVVVVVWYACHWVVRLQPLIIRLW